MTIRINAGEGRSAWSLGAAEARTDLGNTSTDLTDAQGTSMGDLADDLAYDVERVRGVLRLSQVAARTDASPVEAKVAVSTPGYSPRTPTAITEPCFAEAKPPTTLSHNGVPSLDPTRIVPLQP